MDNFFAAYASNAAVAVLEGAKERKDEQMVRQAVEKLEWKNRERTLVKSRRKIERRGKWLEIHRGKGKIKRIKTKTGERIMAARTLLGVRGKMKLRVTERKEDLLAEVYKLHRERAKEVGKECAEAWEVLFGKGKQ